MKITEAAYHDEAEARKYLEALRWPDGAVCPHCGVVGAKVYRFVPKNGKREVLKCAACRKQFSVMTGTIFEDSHIPLHKWLMAFQLYASSKKGMSAHQIHRTLGLSYKSAWFLAHRIRYCMRQSPLKEKLQGIVEADETYVGGKERGGQRPHWPSLPRSVGRRAGTKTPVVTLLERDGRARSFVMEHVTGANLAKVLRENVALESRLMTDQFPAYREPGKLFLTHESVDHSRLEYARGDVSTNLVEGYFSILKRGLNGVYHHVGRQHLHRYLSEFDFRYSHRVRLGIEDDERARIALSRAEGRRLTYQPLRLSKADHLGQKARG